MKKMGMGDLIIEQTFGDFKVGLADKEGISMSRWPSCNKTI